MSKMGVHFYKGVLCTNRKESRLTKSMDASRVSLYPHSPLGKWYCLVMQSWQHQG